MKIKAVLFDLDGVLIDSEGTYTDFWAEIDRKYPTGVDNFALVIKGSTLDTILGKYFAEDEQEAIRQELREFEDEMPYRLFDGVGGLLAYLKESQIGTAIVTSSNRRKMERLMKEVPVLAEYIDTLVTDEDVTASKPDPQGYLIAAERLGAMPDSFVVVEDSLNGLMAGRRSGGKVVGIATTNPRDAIENLADVVLGNVSELIEWISEK